MSEGVLFEVSAGPEDRRNPDMVIEGLRYKQMRESLNLTRERAANMLGVSRQCLFFREEGHVWLRPEHWLAMEAVTLKIAQARLENFHSRPAHKVLAQQFKEQALSDLTPSE